MELWIFDVDGTLTRTNRLDAACYQRAVADYVDLASLGEGWDEFEHPTAAGITRELLAESADVDRIDEALEAVRSAFAAQLEAAVEEGVDVEAMPGAGELLERIRYGNGTAAAIATGDWGESSRYKLRRAGLEVDALPFACSDDAVARADIIETAVRRAREEADAAFTETWYVGDGTWDLAAARELDIGFVGVGAGERAEKLRDAGARTVVEHLTESPAAVDSSAR